MPRWLLWESRVALRPLANQVLSRERWTSGRFGYLTRATGKSLKDAKVVQSTQAASQSPSLKQSHHIERAVEFRHILRGLLRECTYLPDSFAQDWIRQYVLRRFRTYGFKAWEHRDDPSFEERLQQKLREAKQGVNQLRRANEGELKPLLKVLLMAYGRIGKRRHELMTPLMPKAPPREQQSLPLGVSGQLDVQVSESKGGEDVGTSGDVETTSNLEAVRKPSRPSAKQVNQGEWTAYVRDFTPQMRALLQSQIQNPPPHITRPTLRRMQPRLEELNSWLRPMPRLRVKHQTRDWYAELLDRVHPPLPRPEWMRLHDLALGKVTEPLVPRRVQDATQPSSALELVAVYGKPAAQRVFGNRNAHQITPRYMRRLWAKVFSQCPVMEYYAEKMQWKVTWGERVLHGSNGTATTGKADHAAVGTVGNTDGSNHQAFEAG